MLIRKYSLGYKKEKCSFIEESLQSFDTWFMFVKHRFAE